MAWHQIVKYVLQENTFRCSAVDGFWFIFMISGFCATASVSSKIINISNKRFKSSKIKKLFDSLKDAVEFPADSCTAGSYILRYLPLIRFIIFKHVCKSRIRVISWQDSNIWPRDLAPSSSRCYNTSRAIEDFISTVNHLVICLYFFFSIDLTSLPIAFRMI